MKYPPQTPCMKESMWRLIATLVRITHNLFNIVLTYKSSLTWINYLFATLNTSGTFPMNHKCFVMITLSIVNVLIQRRIQCFRRKLLTLGVIWAILLLREVSWSKWSQLLFGPYYCSHGWMKHIKSIVLKFHITYGCIVGLHEVKVVY